jgi:hypothetical protein
MRDYTYNDNISTTFTESGLIIGGRYCQEAQPLLQLIYRVRVYN